MIIIIFKLSFREHLLSFREYTASKIQYKYTLLLLLYSNSLIMRVNYHLENVEIWMFSQKLSSKT